MRVCLVGIANHAEQRFGLRLAIEYKVGIEDFMAAVFGVGLGKHHQLDIAGVAPQSAVIVEQIIDFVVRQGQAHLAVGCHQRGFSAV